MHKRRRFLTAGLAAGLLVLARGARAHGHAGHGGGKSAAVAKEQQEWGIAGDAKDVKRTVVVAMSDDMRFTPDRIEVRLGQTIRFDLRNKGKMLHEMVIGTPPELAEHAELMRKFPDMEHEAPWMAHVEPGGRGEIVWTFNRAGEFQFACLIPGHYEAGMVGKLVVK
jgi:uncharacterized cupredoxin-like copper-binding protein